MAALVLMVLISVVVGRLLAQRVLRPLRLITAATRNISANSLDRRLAVTGPNDEVKDLADTIDDLLGRLEASFAAQRRFVANASHELRTPLATIRASLDVAAAKPDAAASTVALADRVRTQLDRLDHLLDGLLVLAWAQHGSFADAAPVDLGDLVQEALRQRQTDAAAKGLHVTVDLPGPMVVVGSPALLARLGGNVVDNAVIHNENGGWIDLVGSVAGAEAVLAVNTLCQMIAERDVRPMVLMLTAASAPGDRVSGLTLGADDCLGKPFHFPELVLRTSGRWPAASRTPGRGPCASPVSTSTRCSAAPPATVTPSASP